MGVYTQGGLPMDKRGGDGAEGGGGGEASVLARGCRNKSRGLPGAGSERLLREGRSIQRNDVRRHGTNRGKPINL